MNTYNAQNKKTSSLFKHGLLAVFTIAAITNVNNVLADEINKAASPHIQPTSLVASKPTTQLLLTKTDLQSMIEAAQKKSLAAISKNKGNEKHYKINVKSAT